MISWFSWRGYSKFPGSEVKLYRGETCELSLEMATLLVRLPLRCPVWRMPDSGMELLFINKYAFFLKSTVMADFPLWKSLLRREPGVYIYI